MITDFKLYESITGKEWLQIDTLLKEIYEITQEEDSDNFFNIEIERVEDDWFKTQKPQELLLKIIELFNSKNREFIELFIDNNLWFEDYPDHEEMVFHNIYDLYETYMEESERRLIKSIYPDFEEVQLKDYKMKKNLKKYNI